MAIVLKAARNRSVSAIGFIHDIGWFVTLVGVTVSGCSGEKSLATLKIVSPESETTLKRGNEPFGSQDVPGFQYKVKAKSNGLSTSTAVELLIDGMSFDNGRIVAVPSEDGSIIFQEITLPPGVHRLQAATINRSVASEEAAYTLMTLEITEPGNGMKLSHKEDSDASTDGVQHTVTATAYGVILQKEVSLFIDGVEIVRTKATTESTESTVTFKNVDFPSGRVTVLVRAELGDGSTIESDTYTVTVAETCAWIDIISPKPLTPSASVLLGPADDTVGERCGDEYGIRVAVSTDAGHGQHANLYLDDIFTDVVTIEGTLAAFKDIALDPKSTEIHTIKVEVENLDGEKCSGESLLYVVVDCEGRSCGKENYHIENGQCVKNEACVPTTCSGHGACSGTGGVVSCDCEKGYQGDYCEQCATGYHKKEGACVENESCSKTNPCGSHGTCSDDTGEAICNCANGYTGRICNRCGAGFHDTGNAELVTCELDTVCLPTTCAEHGECSGSGGVVKCVCGEGYSGTYCDGPCTEKYYERGSECILKEKCGSEEATDLDRVCRLKGTCNDSSGVAVCTCNVQGYTGDHCEKCSAGFQDNDDDGVCNVNCASVATYGRGCQHGVCIDASGTATCHECGGWRGALCETCESEVVCKNECCASYRNVCDANTGACCLPVTCDDLNLQCGPGKPGSDGCGHALDCGDCGASGKCQGAYGEGECNCQPNYGVLKKGHECVYACQGYLPAEGCCGGMDENTAFWCSTGGSLVWEYCPDGCGWVDTKGVFGCGGVIAPVPQGQIRACPSNIKKTAIVDCIDDSLEYADPDGDDPKRAIPVQDGLEVNAAKCEGDEDFYAIPLNNDGATVTVVVDFDADQMPVVELVLYYDDFSESENYFVGVEGSKSSAVSPLSFQWRLDTSKTFPVSHPSSGERLPTGTYFLRLATPYGGSGDYRMRFTILGS